jgi:hypothetical protein
MKLKAKAWLTCNAQGQGWQNPAHLGQHARVAGEWAGSPAAGYQERQGHCPHAYERHASAHLHQNSVPQAIHFTAQLFASQPQGRARRLPALPLT